MYIFSDMTQLSRNPFFSVYINEVFVVFALHYTCPPKVALNDGWSSRQREISVVSRLAEGVSRMAHLPPHNAMKTVLDLLIVGKKWQRVHMGPLFLWLEHIPWRAKRPNLRTILLTWCGSCGTSARLLGTHSCNFFLFFFCLKVNLLGPRFCNCFSYFCCLCLMVNFVVLLMFLTRVHAIVVTLMQVKCLGVTHGSCLYCLK